MEAKGPKGSSEVYKRQALYNGVLSARGVYKLWSYIDPETSYNDNTYMIASIYHGGSRALKLYITYYTRSTDSNRDYEFYMT